MSAHLGLHARPALLLLLSPPHVLVLLLGLRHGLKELIKDAEELIGLYFVCVFSKVLHGLGKLGREQIGGRQAEGTPTTPLRPPWKAFNLMEQRGTCPVVGHNKEWN